MAQLVRELLYVVVQQLYIAILSSDLCSVLGLVMFQELWKAVSWQVIERKYVGVPSSPLQIWSRRDGAQLAA